MTSVLILNLLAAASLAQPSFFLSEDLDLLTQGGVAVAIILSVAVLIKVLVRLVEASHSSD